MNIKYIILITMILFLCASCTRDLKKYTYACDDGNKHTATFCKTEAAGSIGEAAMKKDGTIILNLRATDKEGKITGDAQFIYPPDHPEYQKILKHVSPIKPGETKPCPPWVNNK